MHAPLLTLFLTSILMTQVVDLPESCRAPPLPVGKPIKIMTYNIQFALGKFTRFWEFKTQEMPPKEKVEIVLQDIRRVIREQKPDILFLQEVSRHSIISHYIDQLSGIRDELGESYCQKSHYYWNNLFVPAPNMLGPMDYSLVAFSRYAIRRQRITYLPENWITLKAWFSPKRILLETDLLVEDMRRVSLLNTHLEAHDKTGKLRMSQAKAVASRLKELQQKKIPFILAGDFNLIPPGTRDTLPENQQKRYLPSMTMDMFYRSKNTAVIPSLQQVNGHDRQKWFTAYDENLYQLDLVLDYLIYSSSFELVESQVLQEHYNLSDHVPVTATLYIKESEITP